jgi:hypothetical protein
MERPPTCGAAVVLLNRGADAARVTTTATKLVLPQVSE